MRRLPPLSSIELTARGTHRQRQWRRRRRQQQLPVNSVGSSQVKKLRARPQVEAAAQATPL